jgi:hypothetical protein
MHRARIAVENLGDAGEIDRGITALDLACQLSCLSSR